MKYDNYIFDLDGTLLETIEDLAAACNYALRSHNLPEFTVDEVQARVGNGVKKLMERTVPEGVGNPDFNEVYQAFREYYLNHNTVFTKPYAGIIDMLKTMQSAGKRVAVVSNKFDAATKALVAHYFGPLVPVAIGESQGINKKPSPDMVVEAMRQLGCTREGTVYVGDSDVDIATARNSGLPCLSVLWGFRDRAFLMAHGATTLLSHPADIVAL